MKREYLIFAYNIVVWLVFGFIYSFFIQNESDFLTVGNTKRDSFSAIYFSASTHSTVGFGDITPHSVLLKSLVMLHIFLVLAGNLGIYLFLKL
jgi:voltage-gated potassium channel Kch